MNTEYPGWDAQETPVGLRLTRDNVTLWNADCLEAINHEEATFDAAITSPPYNLGGRPWEKLGHWKPGDAAGGRSKWRNGSDAGAGIQYGEHNDAMPWGEYVEWQRELLGLLWARCGAVFYNHKPRVIGAKLWLPLELAHPAMILRQIIIWARPGGMNFNPTAFVPTHEWIMFFAHENYRLKSRGASGLGDVWEMTPAYDNPHPAPFPLSLPSRVIDAAAPSRVLDPFMGSGTTGVACAQFNVEFVGIEKDPKWFSLAVENITAALLTERSSLFPATQTVKDRDLFTGEIQG